MHSKLLDQRARRHAHRTLCAGELMRFAEARRLDSARIRQQQQCFRKLHYVKIDGRSRIKVELNFAESQEKYEYYTKVIFF